MRCSGIIFVEILCFTFRYIDKTHLMKKLSIYFAYLSCMSLYAQENAYHLISPTGQKLAAIEYDDVGYFHQNLAWIKWQNGYGYIDISGKEVIPANKALFYEEAGDFAANGLAMVRKGGLYGFIDKTGNEIIKCQFDATSDFGENQLVPTFKNEKWGAIDKTGNWLIPANYASVYVNEGVVVVYNHEKFALFSDKGKDVTGFIYDNIGGEFGLMTEGLIPVRKAEKWGFINKNGEIAVSMDYEQVGRFSEGLCPIVSNGKIAYINATGKQITEAVYAQSDEFSEGLAAVKKDDFWGYIDKTGKVVIPFSYESANKFDKGGAYVVKEGAEIYINAQNQVVAAPTPQTNDNQRISKEYMLEKIEKEGVYTFMHPKLQLKIEKYYLGNGNAKEGKIYDLGSNQLLGEKVTFERGLITSGTFYYEGKNMKINQINVNLSQLKSEIAIQAQKPATPIQALDKQTSIQLYEDVLALIEKADKMHHDYYVISLAFDIDAATEEQRQANLKKKIQPYSDAVAEIVEKCDILLVNDKSISKETIVYLENIKKKYKEKEAALLK